MKIFLLALSLFISATTFARPQPRFDLVGTTESFGTKLSTQNLLVHVSNLENIVISADRAKIGRPAFEFFVSSIVVKYMDDTTDTILVNKWFHKSLNVYLGLNSNKLITEIKLTALHDDTHQSSSSHRISV